MSDSVPRVTNERTATGDLTRFRERCRAFLAAEPPTADVGADPRGERTLFQARAFQGRLSAAGLAGLTYPLEYGGQGLTPFHEQVWREEYGRGPDLAGPLKISHGMCLPVLNQFGTHEQKARHLARNISADEVWCQMFSEPGAGSDVAALQMRAVRDGEGWTLSGQKVWTTLAHVCDFGFVLARTDPDLPKHQGISMFIVDMRSAGIEVRGIRQLDGRTPFNEVFFTDVEIPGDALVGPLHDGWRVATAMLMYERVAIGSGSAGGMSRPFTDALLAEVSRRGEACDPVLRQQLVRLYIEETIKSITGDRVRAELEVGHSPGPGGSLGKLHGAGIARLTRSLVPQVLGMNAVASPEGDAVRAWGDMVLTSFQASIAGGTDEIQRNILGERVLGLPREPAVDRDVPFSALRTNPGGGESRDG
jgi:alkylation response protein AidB-like acyl-CoA dehydrogenase